MKNRNRIAALVAGVAIVGFTPTIAHADEHDFAPQPCVDVACEPVETEPVEAPVHELNQPNAQPVDPQPIVVVEAPVEEANRPQAQPGPFVQQECSEVAVPVDEINQPTQPVDFTQQQCLTVDAPVDELNQPEAGEPQPIVQVDVASPLIAIRHAIDDLQAVLVHNGGW
jgi:hypothetical protein